MVEAFRRFWAGELPPSEARFLLLVAMLTFRGGSCVCDGYGGDDIVGGVREDIRGRWYDVGFGCA